MLESLAGPIGSVAAQTASFHASTGIEDVMGATVGFSSGAVGTLTSIWHDVLSRPSLRRVEVFCEHRCAVLEGEGWFGPVTWTDSDGRGGELGDDALVEATVPLLDGPANPDGAFVEAALRHEPATPDFAAAVRAHEVVDAMYRSAAGAGTVTLP
jgi:predicted dehydrogenase